MKKIEIHTRNETGMLWGKEDFTFLRGKRYWKEKYIVFPHDHMFLLN